MATSPAPSPSTATRNKHSMPTYRVINKTTGLTDYAYSADAAIDLPEYPAIDFEHIEIVPIAGVVTPTTGYVITKLDYLRRFTQAERIAVRAAAKQSPELEDYLSLLDLAENVDLQDPDIVGALAMLEYAGLIGAGRAAEIANGNGL